MKTFAEIFFSKFYVKFTAVCNIPPRFLIGKPNFKDNLPKFEFDFEFPRSFLDFVRHRETMHVFGIGGHSDLFMKQFREHIWCMYSKLNNSVDATKAERGSALILRKQIVSGSALLTIRTSRIDSAKTKCKRNLLPCWLLVSWMYSTCLLSPQLPSYRRWW